MRSCPRGSRRSVDRGAHRPAIEQRKIPILGADAVQMAEGNTFWRVIASARTTRRGQRTWHVQTLLAREPGDLAIDRAATAVGSASGRRGAVADDARSREVRLCHSSSEADEQSGPNRSGAGGAKGGGQGERAPAKHAPDTGTGARGTSAGARTASRKATEEGEVHCTPPPHQHRLPADGVLRSQTRCRLRGGWTDVADLRSRP